MHVVELRDDEPNLISVTLISCDLCLWNCFYRQVQEARKNHDDEGAKQAIHEFDETIDK